MGPGLPRLSADTLARLEVHGLIVVGLVADGDEAADRALRRLGVAQVVVTPRGDAAAAAQALARAVGEAATRRAARRRLLRGPAVRACRGRTRTLRRTPPPPGRPAPNPATERRRRSGRLVAVWGPTGAPGRTSVAVALADEAARSGTDTLLVDADTYSGSAAATLGVLDEASGLALACRAATGHPRRRGAGRGRPVPVAPAPAADRSHPAEPVAGAAAGGPGPAMGPVPGA